MIRSKRREEASMELNEIDLGDPEVFAHLDHHQIFARLRAEDPVHRTKSPFGDYWSVTRYEDVRGVYRDPETFSSERGGVICPSSRGDAEMSREEQGCGVMMIVIDPPRHNTMRRAFNRGFLPRAMAQLDPPARSTVAEILEQARAKGTCDFVADVSARLPMVMICEMMRIPKAEWPMMIQAGNMALGFDDPEYQINGSSIETRRRGFQQIGSYCLTLALERRANPGDDLISVIANSEVDGKVLDERELMFNCVLFVLGGLETTRQAISGGVHELLNNPEQGERLARDRSLMPTAIEEILRWVTPITQLMRTASHDTELRGQRIREGDRVVVWNASANRDEDAFPEADRFDVARSPNDHLAFGGGEHFCIGAHLARLQLRVMLEALLPLLPRMKIAGEVERLASNLVLGIKHMPVSFG
jgi:cytochrome P450